MWKARPCSIEEDSISITTVSRDVKATQGAGILDDTPLSVSPLASVSSTTSDSTKEVDSCQRDAWVGHMRQITDQLPK